MKEQMTPMKSLKITAMVYATDANVVAHVREHGVLPDKIRSGGFPTAFAVLTRRRGFDPDLTEKEQLVLDAILRGSKMTGGVVKVIDELDAFPDDEE